MRRVLLSVALAVGLGGVTPASAVTHGAADAGAADAGAADAGVADAGVADAGPARDGGADPGVIAPGGLPPDFEAPEAMASPGVEEIQLGRPFSLFVSVTHPPGVRVNLPSVIPSLRGAFDELRRTSGTSKRADGTPVREFELELIPWVVGELRIPPIELTYVVDGKVYRVRTKAVPLKVISVIGDGEEKLRDIVPPVHVTRRDWFLLYLVSGLFLALITGLSAWRFFRSMRQRPRRAVRRVPGAVSLSADAEALARLDALKRSGALDAEDLEPGFVFLSQIVRRYLGRRYGFPALELTTSEIHFRLGNVPGGEQARNLLGNILELADFAKYAGYESASDELRAAVGTARGLVEGTRYVTAPRPVAAPPTLVDTPAETLERTAVPDEEVGRDA